MTSQDFTTTTITKHIVKPDYEFKVLNNKVIIVKNRIGFDINWYLAKYWWPILLIWGIIVGIILFF